MAQYLWTSEYVSAGHPDKVADQISDAILDEYLKFDPNSHVACETMIKGNKVFISGEITSETSIDIESVVRKTISDIGYDNDEVGFNGNNCEIIQNISKQSPEINGAVTKDDNTLGAGDQGLMFGYATNETPTYMPTAIYLAKKLINVATREGSSEDYKLFRPDMKSQITLMMENSVPKYVDSVVFSACHIDSFNLEYIRDFFHEQILPKFADELPEDIGRLLTYKTKFLINPAGSWTIGGPVADCGLTGRKIVVDQYGADCEIGGGAFSGKDPSKVDRSAAYAARALALWQVKYGGQSRCKVQIAYAIGKKEPVSVRMYNPLTGEEIGVSKDILEDLQPQNIISRYKLKNPIYLYTAKNGHFGNEYFKNNGIEYFTWEK
jgi:S-adenosylmethionine synthetase